MTTIECNENFNLIKTCRLCLNQNKKLISIFDISSFRIHYLIMISECTGVTIFENDELPKKICLECVECLNKFYQFRQSVVNSERFLRDFLNQFRNNLNTNVKIENTNYIKQEIESFESPNTPFWHIKREEYLHDFEEHLEIDNKFQVIEKEIIINENDAPSLTLSAKSHGTEHSEIESKIEIVEEDMEINGNEKDLNNYEKIHQKIDHVASSSQPIRYKKFDASKKPYICHQCDKAFPIKSNLIVHARIHTGEKPYICDQCGKLFSDTSGLRRHEKIHRGEKSYDCSQCNKAFGSKSDLQRHEHIHTGEKPHVCKQCDKAFIEKSTLKIHERMHSGEKPCNCTQCGMSFTHTSALRRHERVHNDEKPFNCKLCDKIFRHKGNLRIHERTHTGEKPFACKQCGKSYTQSNSLRKHEKTHIGKYGQIDIKSELDSSE